VGLAHSPNGPVSTKGRLSVFTPSSRPPAFRLTERDIAAIEAVYTYRFLTALQLHRLCFSGKETARRYTEHRLKCLFHAGYLGRMPKPSLRLGAPLAVYCLEQKGRDLLADRAGVAKREIVWEKWDNQKSLFFLEHTLALNELRINLSLALPMQGHTLLRYLDEQALRSQTFKQVVDDPLGGGAKIPLVPDGFCQLQLRDNRKLAICLELDRATEDMKQFKRKIRGYIVLWESGLYLRTYQTHSLTVLTVVSGRNPAHAGVRCGVLKEWTEAERRVAHEDTFSDLFWFTTLSQATPQQILTHPIWSVAGSDSLHQLIE